MPRLVLSTSGTSTSMLLPGARSCLHRLGHAALASQHRMAITLHTSSVACTARGRKKAAELAGASEQPSSSSPAATPAAAQPAAKRRRKKEAVPADAPEQLPAPSAAAAATPKPAAARATAAEALDLHVHVPKDEAFASISRWVTFSDLHVNRRTLKTCLKVLQRVHEEAAQRKAGILFLGDFWDKRGDLPVLELNAVLDELHGWQQPMLMLPGNHDQVDIGGAVHSLRPLTAACRHAHSFDEPTLYRGALWLPYRRHEAMLRSAIAQAGEVQAIFAHADVLTAHMNAAYQAREGLPPDLFPQVPVYMGHYHYPHDVQNTSITYLGSPYQVSRSEAGQSKRLLVLGSSWQVEEEIPLDVGPRYYSFASLKAGQEGVAALGLREGDSVCCDLEADMAPAEAEGLKQQLEAQGVQLQVRMQPPAKPPRIEAAEDLSMQQLLDTYAAATSMAPQVLERANATLQSLGAGVSTPPEHTQVQFDQVELEGFGPFHDAVTYDLANKGLRAISGCNEDDGSTESNGTGKTTLVSSIFWAFKAGDGRRLGLAEVINEDKKKARVRITGKVNGQPFDLERTAVKRGSGAAGSMRLVLDGRDMTQQDTRLTDELVESTFNAALMGRTLFFGQEELMGLLESNDKKFKEMLGAIVDIDVWDDAKDAAALKLKEAKQQLDFSTTESALVEQHHQALLSSGTRAQQQEQAWQELHAQRTADAQAVVATAGGQLAAAIVPCLRAQAALHTWAGAVQCDEVREPSAEELSAVTAAEPASPIAEEMELEPLPPLPPLPEMPPLPQFDEAAAEKVLQPLRQALDLARDTLLQQQLATKQAEAELAAARKRLKQYAFLRHSTGADAHPSSTAINASSSSGGSSSNGKRMPTRVKPASAGARRNGVAVAEQTELEERAEQTGGLHEHASTSDSPVCDKCMQPIDLDMYHRQVAEREQEVTLLEQQHSLHKQKEAVLQQQVLAADQQLQDTAAEQQAQRRRIQQQQEEQEQQRNQQQRQRDEQQQARERAAQERQQLQQQRQEEQMRQLREQAEEQMRQERVLQDLRTARDSALNAISTAQHSIQQLKQRTDLPGTWSLDQLLAQLPWTPDPAPTDANSAQRLCKLLAKAAAAAVHPADSLLDARAEAARVAAEANPHTSECRLLQQQAQEAAEKLSQLRSQAQELGQEVSWLKEVDTAFSRSGIPSFVLEGVLGELQRRCATYLQQLSNGMTLELNATQEKKSSSGRVSKRAALEDAAAASAAAAPSKEEVSKVIRVQAADGELRQRTVWQLSGGERKRVALALALGFTDLAAARGRLTSNLLVLDEVLEKLDGEGCARVASMLRTLPHSTVLVVGQANSFVTDAFGAIDYVVKRGGHATIQVADD